MRYLLLTRIFPHERFGRALESWHWIGLDGMSPVLSSLFGDVFLQAADGYWFLDTVEGTLTHRSPDREALQQELESEEGQDQYLLGGLAIAADSSGLTLGPDQVYDFTQPPILGGSFSIENITIMDFVVSLNIAGQLMRQVRDMKPGTPITGFSVDGA